MGCGSSKEHVYGDDSTKARNDQIERQLRNDRMKMRNEIKMLLLGKK